MKMVGDTVDAHPFDTKKIDALTPEIRPIEALGESFDSPAPIAQQIRESHIAAPESACPLPALSRPLRVYLRLVTSSSDRGPLYSAQFSGQAIVKRSAQPFLDACRVLRDHGLRGPVELWDYKGTGPRMHGVIEDAAQLAVDETGTPRFRNHRQHWRQAPKTASDDTSAT